MMMAHEAQLMQMIARALGGGGASIMECWSKVQRKSVGVICVNQPVSPGRAAAVPIAVIDLSVGNSLIPCNPKGRGYLNSSGMVVERPFDSLDGGYETFSGIVLAEEKRWTSFDQISSLDQDDLIAETPTYKTPEEVMTHFEKALTQEVFTKALEEDRVGIFRHRTERFTPQREEEPDESELPDREGSEPREVKGEDDGPSLIIHP